MDTTTKLLAWLFITAVALGDYQAPYTHVETVPVDETARIAATKIEAHLGEIYFSHATGISKLLPSYQVSLVVGQNVLGHQAGTVDEARFRYPNGIGFDSRGNLYIADTFNHVIKKVTPSGIVINLAGNGSEGHKDGTGSQALFRQPRGIAVDGEGNVLVADSQNNCIRMISRAGQVSTIAGSTKSGFEDGDAQVAKFNSPTDVAVDKTTGIIYVADPYNSRLRMVHQGRVSTVAGNGEYGNRNGPADSAQLNMPKGIAVDKQGRVYFIDSNSHSVRVLDSGHVHTLAGGPSGEVDGDLSKARFSNPTDISIADNGDLYVLDYYNRRLRRIVRAAGTY